MGWTFMNAPGGKSADRIVRSEFKANKLTVVASAMVGDTWYGAVRRGKAVEGYVVLTERSGGEFGYKDMPEWMGPYETDCPKAILDLLSPTADAGAIMWRAGCYAKLAA